MGKKKPIESSSDLSEERRSMSKRHRTFLLPMRALHENCPSLGADEVKDSDFMQVTAALNDTVELYCPGCEVVVSICFTGEGFETRL